MKCLKFYPELCHKIINGEKTSTWRLFDDKNLTVGDNIIFLNRETKKQFGTAIITRIKIKTLGTLTDADWEGHERYTSEQEMYATYRKYYGDTVSPDTEIKMIDFTFTSISK